MQPNNRKFYLLVAAFVLAAVVVGLVYSRRTKSSVQQWKEARRAKGEHFTIAELLPQRRGPTTNRLADLVRLGDALQAQAQDLNGIEHFHFVSNSVAEAAWMRPQLGLTTAAPGTPRGRVPRVTHPYEWPDLAAEMAGATAILAEVHALLSVPDHDTGWNYDLKVPMPRCYVQKRTLAQWLAAANTHCLHEGRTAEAGSHLTALVQLVAWHDEDFTLINQMIRTAVGSLALASTWGTMQSPGVTEAQLAGWQAQWQRLGIMPALARAMEFERAEVDQYFIRVRSGEESLSAATFGAIAGTGSTGLARVGEQATGMVWRMLAAEGDELFYLRIMQEHIDMLRLLARDHSWAAAQPRFTATMAELAILETWRGKLQPVSSVALPNLTRAFRTALLYEGRREMTIAALALERFRRQHGRHPQALKELVPAFVPAVPVDWMDGQPLRYRLNADGTYTLWSIGEDLKDDGGDGTELPTTPSRVDFWERRDVVWPRAVK